MRIFRSSASLWPLVCWNLIAGIAIAGLLTLAAETRTNARFTLYGLAWLGILMGPISLIAYLLRYLTVRIELDSDGLILSRRHVLPWWEIQAVTLRGWQPGPWNPFRSISVGRYGCIWIVFFKALALFIAVLLLLWILRAVLLPVLVLYSPWHSRVVIELTDGTKLVYRDLEDEEEFVELVRERLRPSRTP